MKFLFLAYFSLCNSEIVAFCFASLVKSSFTSLLEYFFSLENLHWLIDSFTAQSKACNPRGAAEETMWFQFWSCSSNHQGGM